MIGLELYFVITLSRPTVFALKSILFCNHFPSIGIIKMSYLLDHNSSNNFFPKSAFLSAVCNQDQPLIKYITVCLYITSSTVACTYKSLFICNRTFINLPTNHIALLVTSPTLLLIRPLKHPMPHYLLKKRSFGDWKLELAHLMVSLFENWEIF